MDRGTIGHCMFLTPELIDVEFAINPYSLTSSSEKLINYMIETYNLLDDDPDLEIEDITMDYLIKASEELELFANIKKVETLTKHLGAMNIYDILKFKIENKNKYVVSQEIYNEAEYLVEKLNNWDFLNLYLVLPGEKIKGIEVLNETAIYWTYTNDELRIQEECKSLLDQIVINHNTKTVKINDLKFTKTQDPISFKKHALSLGYHLQAYYYKCAVLEWMKINYPEYTFEGFYYICIPTGSDNPPYCFLCTDDFYDLGKNGGVYQGDIYNGIDELFESLNWSKETNNWYFHKNTYLNKGLFHL
jgi:hypothetical protein